MQVIFLKQEKINSIYHWILKNWNPYKEYQLFSLLLNRSEIKQSGWFTSSQPVEDEITKERKHPIHRFTRITSSRITGTPRAAHHPTRLTPLPPTAAQPTHLAPRPRPTPRITTYTTNEVKVYSEKDDQDRTSQMMLPPTTTALVVKKPVK